MRRLGSSRFAKQLLESQIPIANSVLMILEPSQKFLFTHGPDYAIGLDKFAILISFRVRRERHHEQPGFVAIPGDLVTVLI